ncbi:MAG: CHASE2 domain-containing protein [Chloroflexi bacterium]|nr:CHASE2 domain-containing protein [Chloroflexota bacterium]
MTPRISSRTRDQIIIIAVAVLVVMMIWQSGFFTTARLRISDFFFVGTISSSATVQRSEPAPISIIAIDDQSLQAYGRSLTSWDRTIYANLVDLLSASGARVVAFDLIFSEPSEADAAVAEALEAARAGDNRMRSVLAVAGAGTLTRDTSLSADGIRFQSALEPVQAIAEQADYLGYVNTVTDVDGLIRRQPSLIGTESGEVGFSFVLATYLAYLRVPASAAEQLFSFEDNAFALSEGTTVHHDNFGFWRQNFVDITREPFPTYSLVDVLEGTINPSDFDGKIVMVGLANSQGLADTYYVPLVTEGRPVAGVQILAHGVATLLYNEVPFEQSPASIVVMLTLLAVVSSIVFLRIRWYVKLIAAPLFVLLFFVGASVNFSLRHELVNLFDGTLAILLPVGLTLGYEIRVERRARTEAELLFKSADGQRRLLDAVLMRSPLPMIIVNCDLHIIRSNRAFDALFGSGNPSLLSRLSGGGLNENTFDDVRACLIGPKRAAAKIVCGESSFMLQAAPIQESDFVVATMTDVTSLDQLAELKTRLIRIAAHDIRNPLSSIIGFVELLMLDRKVLSERQIDMLERTKRSADSINAIITNLLKLEQLRSAKLPMQPVMPAIWLGQIAEGHGPDMARRQHHFVTEIQGELPVINAEPIQLGQAVSNLLSNAAKYTPDGGEILLRAKGTEAGHLRIEVTDNGFGIPKDAQDQIFAEFYRVQHGQAAERPGTGLGLSLVKTIVEAHRGRVWVESEEGKGSSFFIELPVNESKSENGSRR